MLRADLFNHFKMKNLIGLLCLVLLIACDKKETPAPPSKHLVTGFNFTNKYGSPTGTAGNPNVKTSMEVNGNRFFLSACPNPVNTDVQLSVYTTASHQQKKVWIEAAPQSGIFAPYNFPKANINLIGGQPVWEKASNTGWQQEVFVADFSSLPAGAYRVYVQFDDVLLWDNLLKK